MGEWGVAIREATEADAEAMARITNDSIVREAAHFALEPEPVAAMVEAVNTRRDRHAWFAAVSPAGAVVGYAKSYDYKPRAAYRWTCEVGIYIDAAWHGRGVGRALYERLLGELAARGYRCVVAGITLPNPASERLHTSVGFARVGVYPAIGFKMGAWRDVVLYALTLGDPAAPPDPSRPAAISL